MAHTLLPVGKFGHIAAQQAGNMEVDKGVLVDNTQGVDKLELDCKRVDK